MHQRNLVLLLAMAALALVAGVLLFQLLRPPRAEPTATATMVPSFGLTGRIGLRLSLAATLMLIFKAIC